MTDYFAFDKPFHLHCSSSGVAAGYWFLFMQGDLLLASEDELLSLPLATAPPLPPPMVGYHRCIGTYASTPCLVAEIPGDEVPAGFHRVTLREAHAFLGGDLWAIAGRASQVLRWRRDHRYCGRCGTEMRELEDEILRRCPACDFFTYPRISPAVIMSVVKDGAILLGRAHHYPDGMYSVLAGFVEPGETLEEAVAREVMEETRVAVKDIRYVASQPWPFPHSLMVGFQALYAGGEIRADGKELADAGWFTPETMPNLPSPISISRKLIDLYLGDQQR